MYDDYQLTIGLEIHAQINSLHKLFSLAQNSTYKNNYEKSHQKYENPNKHITHLEMGLPGILPIVNKDPILEAIKAGLAINGTINRLSFFDRKHYWYYDLPLGYQITQFYRPIVVDGHLDINTTNGPKKIRIKQIHMEADAGKNIHEDNYSLLDYNRVAVCLIETVTEPDMSSAEEAMAFAEEFHRILNYLGVCLGDMEKGNFRMDVNISVQEKSTGRGTNRVEIKNMNSFNHMNKAIHYEYERHVTALKNNEVIPQSTRFYDAEKNKTGLLRLKESANDYMYIRDGDLPPLVINDEMMSNAQDFLKRNLLPQECRSILMGYGLNAKQAYEITKDKDHWEYFNCLVMTAKELNQFNGPTVNFLYNLVTMELANLFNKSAILPWDSKITFKHMLDLVKQVQDQKITMASYKVLLEELWEKGGDVHQMIKEKNMEVITDNSIIENAIDEAIAKNPKEVERYKNGETKLLQFFIGQVMALTKGKAMASVVAPLLTEKLK
jgi:aspartyl-tRNA(Asn)/glutamyl-tRNA(Gln) amidotransferase subunit B